MNTKTTKIIYWSATSLVTVIVLMYVGNSLFNTEVFSKRFVSLGYPTYLIYPITIAKMLGLIAIWSDKSKLLKEWAYAGFCFVFILALVSEINAVNGEYISSPLALIFLFTSYVFWKKQSS